MERIPILIADNHLTVRTQLVARLIREATFEIVALTDTGAATIRDAQTTHPRLILIDPHMDAGSDIALIRQLRTHVPNAIIIVLSAFTDTAQKIELQKLGIHHILDKGIESFELVNILRSAAAA